MTEDILTVREIQASDIPLIVDYWLTSEEAYLTGMGVDLNKLPAKEQLTSNILKQINTPIEQRNAYCIIWQLNNKPIGHSNTNPTNFGRDAFMHLHLWNQEVRSKGMGAELLKLTIPYFFENLELKNLYCEPFALNPAPHRTLQKVGFEFVKEYITVPGPLNYEQPVKQWHLSYDRFKQLYKTDTYIEFGKMPTSE